MAVRSRALVDGQPVAWEVPRLFLVAAGGMSVVFGLVFWARGAAYTRDGWVLGVPWFLQWIGVPVAPIALNWQQQVLGLLVAGLAYSLTERYWPAQRVLEPQDDGPAVRVWRVEPWPVWLIWALVSATDIGSTYAGAMLAPSTDQIGRYFAARPPLAVAGAVVLTYLPEFMLAAGPSLIMKGIWDDRSADHRGPTRRRRGRGAGAGGAVPDPAAPGDWPVPAAPRAAPAPVVAAAPAGPAHAPRSAGSGPASVKPGWRRVRARAR